MLRPLRTVALLATAALPLCALPTAAAIAATDPTAPGPTSFTLHAGSPSAPGIPVPAQQPTHAAGTGLAASTTSAGTIVFVRDHNVWLVRPDGTGLHQVTTDGTVDRPYDDPTMSDTGVIAVARAGQIVRMLQNGAVLNVLTPRDLFLPSPGTLLITPIHEPVISPDGSKIAYSQLRSKQYDGRIRIEELTSVTDAHALSPTTTYGIASGREPSWITPNRVVLSSGGVIELQDLGDHDSVGWFHQDQVIVDDEGYPLQWHGLWHPEFSAAADTVTYLVGDDFVGIGTVSGDPAVGVPSTPRAPACFLASDDTTTPGPVFDAPSLSPDGHSVVYEELGNLWVVSGFDRCDQTTVVRQLVPGAATPDWSPAALNPPAPVIPGGQGGQGGQLSQFTLERKPGTTGARRVGRTVKARLPLFSPAAQGTRIQWLRNGEPIRKATRVNYRITPRDRGRRISVRVSVTRAGYAPLSVTSAPFRVR